MNKAVMLIGFLVLGLRPVVSQADDLPGNGWYGAVSLGVSSYGNSKDDEETLQSQLAAEGIGAVATVNDNPAGWSLGAGYHFNRYVALELDYVDLGKATADVAVFSPKSFTINEDAEAKGESLDVIGSLPLTDMISLFAKLGAFNYSFDETLSSSVPVALTSPSSSGSTFDVGTGVEFHFTNLLGLRAGLTQYHGVGDANTTGKQNIGFAYAQLLLHF